MKLNQSSKVPAHCPKCGSHHFRLLKNAAGDLWVECPDCGESHGPMRLVEPEPQRTTPAWTPEDIIRAETAGVGNVPIKQLDSLRDNVKVKRALLGAGIEKIAQLQERTAKELMKIKWVGEQAVAAIDAELLRITGKGLKEEKQ